MEVFPVCQLFSDISQFRFQILAPKTSPQFDKKILINPDEGMITSCHGISLAIDQWTGASYVKSYVTKKAMEEGKKRASRTKSSL